ncbi:MAG: glycosyltransferase [Clostridia bacterium]|nr:glycosyltransferase [Clostridia bacterium]
MNIALFIEAYHPYVNGVITHVSMLKESLTKMGHNVLIVTADPNLRHHKLENGVVYCPAVKMKKIYGYGLASPKSRTRDKYLRAFKPDIIHIHNEFGVSLFGVQTAKKLGIPVIYTLHTMYDDYFHYVIRGRIQKVAKNIFYKYIHYIASNSDVLISPSAKAIDFFAECGIKKHVDVIPNAIDTATFNYCNFNKDELLKLRNDMNIPQDALLGVFVGRLGAEKSIDYLLNVFAKNFKDNDKYHLLIVGDGPDAEALRTMANDLGLDKTVHFAGKLDHSQIPLCYSAGDYYVSASLTEMMSISMLEAMAVGLPAVVRFDEKNKTQVKDGKTGFIFKTEDEMAEIIKKLGSYSESELEEFKRSIREIMQEQGPDQLAKRILDIYIGATK